MHISEVAIEDLHKVVDLLEAQELVIRAVDSDDEEERRVPVDCPGA